MRKIVVDARMIKSSGIGTYIQNMLPNLINDYELVLLGNPKEIKAFPWAKNLNIINFNSPIYSLSEQFYLPIKIPECDIFISPHYNIPVLPIRAKKRVVILHDVYHFAFYDKLTGLQKLYAKFMINSAVRKSHRIITVSMFSKSEILKYTNADESKIDVVYCGMNPEDFFDNYKGDYTSIIKKYNLPDKFFLFVSNIKPHKNLYNFLLSFHEIIEKNETYKMVVVGEYKKLITTDKNVLTLIEESGKLRKNVIFTGYISRQDLNALYRIAFALIFPSFYEGFGLPPLEAMICSCPVLASSAASIPEACGNAALYFDPYSIGDIKEKLELYISDHNLKDSLIKKGTENIKRFTGKNFASNLKKVLDSI